MTSNRRLPALTYLPLLMLLGVVLMLAMSPGRAHAQGPIDDPRFPVDPGATASTSPISPPAPHGYGALVPASGGYGDIRSAPVQGPRAQTSNPMDPSFWTDQRATGSKWISDNFIVGMAVVFQSGSSAMQELSTVVADAIFTTPLELTTRPSILAGSAFGSPFDAARVVANAATAIMVVLLAYRLVRLMMGYSRDDAIEIAVQFIGGMCLIWGSWYLCDLMIVFANQLARGVVGGAFGDTWPLLEVPPVSPGPGLSLVLALVTFFYYVMLVILCFQAFRRIVLINLMLIVSPLMGLAITTGGAWNYARVWFFRFVELLAMPIIWAASLGFARSLLAAWMNGGPGEEIPRAVIGSILAAFAYALVLEAPRAVGIAARETISSGGVMRGMSSMVAMMSRIR